MTDTQRLLAWLLAATATASGTASCKSSGRRYDDLPGCPSGDWCGTPEAAAKVKSDTTQMVGDCPSALSMHEMLQRTTREEQDALANDPAYEGLDVVSSGVNASLDEAASRRATADGTAATCCYTWVQSCPGGRPLVVGDEAVVAGTVEGSRWHAAFEPLGRELPDATRLAIARAWIEEALAEHASIASFARATLELMAVGAPAELLAEAQRAGLDEIEHARACFGLAAAYGLQRGPGPLPPAAPRGQALATLAVDTFVEACVGETTAALLAERCAATCEIAAVAAALRRIAVDEARHAALGWRTITWLAQRDASVGDRVRAIAAQLRPGRPPASAADAALRAHGRPTPSERERARFDAFTGVVEPMLATLA